MSAPLFVQQYSSHGLPKVRQTWRASRLKFVFDRTHVNQALEWLCARPSPKLSSHSSFGEGSEPTSSEDFSVLLRWCAKRANGLGRLHALSVCTTHNNPLAARAILPYLPEDADLTPLLCESALAHHWEMVEVFYPFARPTPLNTALVAAASAGQTHIVPLLVPLSTSAVLNKALHAAVKFKHPTVVALLQNHCAEWARTDALGQAVISNCVDSVHLLAPLSDCWLVKEWANKSLRNGWQDAPAANALMEYTKPKFPSS